MNQRTRNQGGWVASFVVVGAILVLGLLAGLYYIKTQQLEGGEVAVTETDKGVSDSDKNTPDQSSSKGDSNKKATPPKATDSSKDRAAPKQDGQENKEQVEADDEATPAVGSSSDGSKKELPATGPGDTAAQLIAVFALTVSGVAYIGSRRGL